MNFCKRSYQPILHYRYTEVKKRRSEISLHKHFKGLINLYFFEAFLTKKNAKGYLIK